jgi:hypothetical protein
VIINNEDIKSVANLDSSLVDRVSKAQDRGKSADATHRTKSLGNLAVNLPGIQSLAGNQG